MKRNTSAAKAIVCTVVLWTIPLLLAAQRSVPKLEDLPRWAIDTLDTDDSNIKIVIFTNNTWCYYYPDLNERMDREVYREHWVNDRVFAYTDIQLKELPPDIDLQLIDQYGDFHAPAIGKVFSKYGTRGRRRHQGVDIPLCVGAPIYAAFNGKVRYARYNTGGYGNLVIIRHENGLETWYAHLTRCNVAQDDYVTAGTVIGFCGNTGRSRGAHLHFEMRYCDQAFDPEHLIDFSTGDLRYQTFALDRSFFSIYSRASETLEEEDDYDESLLAVHSPDGELTSEDILENIESTTQAAIKQEQAKTDPLYHTIRRGDYLGKIARQYVTTVKRLCQLNNISEDAIIREGRKLRVR